MLLSARLFIQALELPAFVNIVSRNVNIRTGSSHQQHITHHINCSFSRTFCVQKIAVMSGGVEMLSWEAFFKGDKERLQRQFYDTYKKKRREVHSEEISVMPNLNEKVSLWKGDITKLKIDAIVNAANSSLLGGGGVDGAIHKAAGPKLKEECKMLNGCGVGNAKITQGYSLLAKHVIHTVGPRGEKPDLLKSCYNSSLNLLLENQLQSVAFPCISTGIYGYPQEPAAHVALSMVRKFLEKNPNSVNQVIFCLFLPQDVKIYENLMQIYFPVV